MSSEQGSTDTVALETPRTGLTRKQAIPLAIGSVAGSGILSLPSAVYIESGGNSLIVWVVSVLLCIPMLLMFDDMVKSNPEGDGIESFVRMGLGDVFAQCVPVMFLSLAIVALPAGSLVAGRYVSQAFGSGPAFVGTAVVVLLVALGVNLTGARTSNRVQLIGTWALITMAAVLLTSALTRARFGVETVIPDGSALHVLLPTVVLAFWAFTGFENLTLLSKEFQHPERDFLPVSIIALTVYGIFTMLLTLAIALRIPRGKVDDVAGLLQLAGDIQPQNVVLIAVTVIAFGVMVLNAVSWVWGASRLVADASSRSVLPAYFAVTDSAGVPRRALALLAGLFTVVLGVLAIFPSIVVDALATASAIFILICLLCIVSYLRVRGLTIRSGLYAALLVIMVVSLVQSGWHSLYGVMAFLVTLTIHLTMRRRSARAARPRTGASVMTTDIIHGPSRTVLDVLRSVGSVAEHQYGSSAGHPLLRAALARSIAAFDGTAPDPETEITVTAGATEAIFCALTALLRDGGDVVLLEPACEQYRLLIESAGGTVRSVTIPTPDARLDSAQLKTVCGPQTKAIVVNSPWNSWGRALDAAEWSALAAISAEFGIVVISDETYEHLILDGTTHHGVLKAITDPELRIKISSASNTFGVTGWRIGWAVAGPGLTRQIRMQRQFVTFCSAAPMQIVVASVLDADDFPAVRQIIAAGVRERVHRFTTSLAELGLTAHPPEARFYITADVGTNAHDWCLRMMSDNGVAALPMATFFAEPPDTTTRLVRFAVCKSSPTLDDAILRLRARVTTGLPS